MARGSSSSVFLVVDPDGRRGALKALEPGSDARVQTRFTRELDALDRLDHPRIPSLLDRSLPDSSLSWFVTELAPGRTLADALATGLDVDVVGIAIAEQIGDALASAHALGITHRDLSPRNIVCDGSAAYLIDFGIAAVGGAPDLTTSEAILGTVAYCAPEQLRHTGATTPSADLYGLAACLFAVLTGLPPHPGASAAEIMGRRSLGSRRQLAAGTDAARAACTLIEAALAEDPRARPTDIGAWSQEVADALDALPRPLRQHFVVGSADRTLASEPTTGRTSRRRRLLLGAAAAIAGAAITSAAWPDARPVTAAPTELRAAPERTTVPASWSVGATAADGSVRVFNPANGLVAELLARGTRMAPAWTTDRAVVTTSERRPVLSWHTARRARVALLGATGATVFECSGGATDILVKCRGLLADSQRSDAAPASLAQLRVELRNALSPVARPWSVPATGKPNAGALRVRRDELRQAARSVRSLQRSTGYGWVDEVETLRASLRATADAAARYGERPSLARQRALVARAAAARAAARRLSQLVAVPLPARVRRIPTAPATSEPIASSAGSTVRVPGTGETSSRVQASPVAPPSAVDRPAARRPPADSEPAVEEPIVVGPAL